MPPLQKVKAKKKVKNKIDESKNHVPNTPAAKPKLFADLKMGDRAMILEKPCTSSLGAAESSHVNFITYIYSVFISLQNNVSSFKFEKVSAFLSQILARFEATSTILFTLKR